MRSVQDVFDDYVKLNTRIPPEMLVSVRTIDEPGRLADTIVAHVALKLKDKQELLETPSPANRLERLGELMQGEIEIRQVEKKLRTRVKKQMEKQQKEYYLNEQMQAIQKELGDRDEFKNELTELEQKIKQKKMSKEAKERCLKELKKLKQMSPMSRRGDGRAQLPRLGDRAAVGRQDRGPHDINEAEAILEAEHYGLKKVKERILEYLAVQALVPHQRGPILCLVGPPGVGKTSLARSIAHATGRKFVRQSLGGVRDEAEIRGHRRTYIGALPGKLIQSLKKVGSQQSGVPARRDRQDVDGLPRRSRERAARGPRSRAEQRVQRSLPRSRLRPVRRHVHHDGEPAARDPAAAARSPRDHRAARLHRVGEDRDRAAVPDPEAGREQRRQGARRSTWSDEALTQIIHRYTKEAGVRNLEREIATVCRKIAKKWLAGGNVAAARSTSRTSCCPSGSASSAIAKRAAKKKTRSGSRTGSRSPRSAAIC